MRISDWSSDVCSSDLFRQKAAGLRTHILVALAAAMFTVIAFEIFFEVQEITDNSRSDVIRVIEAVTAGVAFLAAGTIIQSRGSVQGLTTGSSMCLAGAVGPACGGGFYPLALIGTVLADRKRTRLNYSHKCATRIPSPARKTKTSAA